MKDQFTLNKNGWYAKMVDYAWDIKFYEFSHMCPFFWLAVFTFFFFPFILFGKGIAGIFFFIGEKIDEKYEKWGREYAEYLKNHPEELEKFAAKTMCKTGRWTVLWDRYNHFFDSSLENRIDRLRRELLAKKWDAEEQRKKELQTKKEKVYKKLSWMKPVSIGLLWLLGIAALVFGALGLYHLGAWVVTITAEQWLRVLKFLGIIALGVSVLLTIIYFTSKIDVCCETKRKMLRTIGAPFRAIGGFFVILFNVIKNNCPAIKWQ